MCRLRELLWIAMGAERDASMEVQCYHVIDGSHAVALWAYVGNRMHTHLQCGVHIECHCLQAFTFQECMFGHEHTATACTTAHAHAQDKGWKKRIQT